MKKLLCLFIILLSSCAGMNKMYKEVPLYQGAMDKKSYNGKTPEAVVKQHGEPLSVGWVDKSYLGTTKYFIAYPVGNETLSTMELMTSGHNRQCLFFVFHKTNNFKLVEDYGQSGDIFHVVCSELQKKGEYTYDDSLVKAAIPPQK